MDERSQRKMLDVLRVLSESDRPLGGARIAQALALGGREMSQRTIRYYLHLSDQQELTKPVGKRGRVLTTKGRRELADAYVVDKVGFVASRIDALTYGMTFRLRQGKGDVVVNLSTLPLEDMHPAAAIMSRVYQAHLSMGQRLLVSGPGRRVGPLEAGPDQCIVATICSASVNGVLLSEGIPTTNRFGGLLQITSGRPTRFLQIINYDGTTLDPLEIFIKGQMTDVSQAVAKGEGVVGAGFREIPAQAAEKARRLSTRMERMGLGGIMLVGRPGQPLLEIPVSPGRVGLVVVGGLNPLAACEEAGMRTLNRAMGTLMPFEDLKPFSEALASPAWRAAS